MFRGVLIFYYSNRVLDSNTLFPLMYVMWSSTTRPLTMTSEKLWYTVCAIKSVVSKLKGGERGQQQLLSQFLLCSVMAVGTYVCLKRSVLHLDGISLSEWVAHLPLFLIRRVREVVKNATDLVPHPSFCHWLQTVHFQPNHRFGFPDQLVKSAGIIGVDASYTAHIRKELCKQF